ncbi:hypothetical protein [Methylovulum psychrotolerans]|uniref:Uncharacterized protein n=1 Tax=Methylovulum psychrotolerans TaxID=1704499 RepID=A0A2S5CG60_9GAMM|nr:hypothetical protein [Methylovulum psychrotolerans]POZ49789.1 hypothetical protein AADEFJLK_04404 [Methylovulum psychrotolerans]
MNITIKNNNLDFVLKVFCLFVSASSASNASNISDTKYFDFSDTHYSNDRKGLPIVTRAVPADSLSNADYSGACVYFYGGVGNPTMNTLNSDISKIPPLDPTSTSTSDNQLISDDVSQTYTDYITPTKYNTLMSKLDMFYLSAQVMFPIKSMYTTQPDYSKIPHFCEKTDKGLNLTATTNLTSTNGIIGSYIQLKSLSKTKNIFNFQFMTDSIIMETKSQYWWKDTFNWGDIFYPNYDGITDKNNTITPYENNYGLNYFHGPAASISYKVSNPAINNKKQTAIGNYAHLYLTYNLKRNLKNYNGSASEYVKQDDYSKAPPIQTFTITDTTSQTTTNVTTGAFSSGVKTDNTITCDTQKNNNCGTSQNTYNPNKDGTGIRMGISFMYYNSDANNDTNSNCWSTSNNYYPDVTITDSIAKKPDNIPKFTFNFVTNIFDERFEYIDQTPKGDRVAIKYLMVDNATTIQMYRYPLANLINYDNFKIGSFHYNPFKRTGSFTGADGNSFTGINNIDLLDSISSEETSPIRKVITTLVNQGVLPSPPQQCGTTTTPKSVNDAIPDEYYKHILNHLYVTAASTGFETGGLSDLSFTLYDFSLRGSNQ